MKFRAALFLIVLIAAMAVIATGGNAAMDANDSSALPQESAAERATESATESATKSVAESGMGSATESAVLAGGCFWCIESDFEELNGVKEVISGYSGGQLDNPTYKQVSRGGTGHIEVGKVVYDPAVISYTEILDFFWRHIDPTTDQGQFCDIGSQYRPAIFYTEAQKDLAFASREKIEKAKPFSEPIKVELIPAAPFYAAEEYHQDYYIKNPLRYKYYRFSCGRDARVEELWDQ